ncbi:hypothetical protein [Burkholderia sp. Tr-20390]|uniref:hypothetical protein n=1 Tax=Burkholderia sp. Tr-20390 TaxID=2703904 RepID=UPI00197F684F|nr:hypothetical protein [Burkholderia sp. Tr-20390]MBN3729389.1 hypothetical protein [Burkholderia sp. Tr-20390]
MKRLEYRLSQARDGAPLAIIDSALGSGHDISPADLRLLASALLTIADEAENVKLDPRELWKAGAIDLK